jgi:dihydroflavonol-4-reductase
MASLVIGASGHLGAHLVRELIADGEVVRVLVRPTSDLSGLEGLDVEVGYGDVRDPRSIAQAMQGCRYVYHLGAPTRIESGLFRTVVTGARNVLESAHATGVERVVYTSSTVTVGYSRDPRHMLDETRNDLTPASAYHIAKWHAEKLVLSYSEQTGLPVVVVNPSHIVGPLDYRGTSSTEPIRRCVTGGVRVAFPGGVTLAHAQDVARGHILAMRRGIPGERYILGGEPVQMTEYMRMAAEACGSPPIRWSLPRWAMLAAGAGFSTLSLLTRIDPPFSFASARYIVGRFAWYSSAKAERQISYSWRPARVAVRETADWMLSVFGKR